MLTEFTEEVPLTEQESEVLQFSTMQPLLPPLEFFDLLRSSGFVVDEFVN